MFHLPLSKSVQHVQSLTFLLDLFHIIVLIFIRVSYRMIDDRTSTTLFRRPNMDTLSLSHPTISDYASPYLMSNQSSPPYSNSQSIILSSPLNSSGDNSFGLIDTLVHEEGHIYSLAVSADLLYTGSDCKKVSVWKNLKEFSRFRLKSGLVKAIVVSGDKMFTGHMDGKVRVWKVSPKNNHTPCKRIGTLPTTKDLIKSSLNPKCYIQQRRNGNVSRIKHRETVSCMSLDEGHGLLYTGSWDKTVKIWKISDSKCLDTINAHDDAVNGVVAGFGQLVFTGSADGTVKVWRRELQRRSCKHVLVEVLLRQESAITAVAADAVMAAIYCGSSDGLVKFWDNEKRLSYGGVLRGHQMAVLCLAAAADGSLVLSGSADKTICVWRRESGVHTRLAMLMGHCGPVKCLAVEDDHESTKGDKRWVVYSGSLDRSVKVWKVYEHARDLNRL